MIIWVLIFAEVISPAAANGTTISRRTISRGFSLEVMKVVDLVSDGAAGADILEVCWVKVTRLRCSGAVLGSGEIYHLTRKIVSWQVERDKFTDRLQPIVLRANVNMS